MSSIAAFSFYPTKVLGTYGDGGMVVTSDTDLAARVRRLRMYGTERTYYAEEHGYNSRLDEVHAEILRRKLRRIDGYITRRRQLARRYDEQLEDTGLTLPVTGPDNEHVSCVVRHPARDAIINARRARHHRQHQLSVADSPDAGYRPWGAPGALPGRAGRARVFSRRCPRRRPTTSSASATPRRSSRASAAEGVSSTRTAAWPTSWPTGSRSITTADGFALVVGLRPWQRGSTLTRPS
jgi:hypothetical protein